jgi:hypothetical protein
MPGSPGTFEHQKVHLLFAKSTFLHLLTIDFEYMVRQELLYLVLFLDN